MFHKTSLSLLLPFLIACGERPSTTPPVTGPEPAVLEVEASLPGGSALELEAQAAIPLERALLALEGVERITTRCEPGRCVVRLALGAGSDGMAFRDRVQAKLRGLKGLSKAVAVTLRPLRTRDAHVVLLLEPAAGAHPPAGVLRHTAETIVSPRLKQQPGVSEVEIQGGRRPQCLVRFDPTRLRMFDVTPLELADSLARQSSRPGDVGTPTMDELEEMVVTTRNGEPVRLRDLAQVRRELTAVEPGMGATVSMLVMLQSGTDASTLQAVIAGLEPTLPEGVRLRTATPREPAIVVWIAAEDEDQERALTNQVRALVLEVPGVKSATPQLTARDREVVVQLRPERSTQLGVTEAQVAATIQLALRGRTVGTVRRGGESLELVVRADPDPSLDRVNDLRIRGKGGVVLPLSSIATLRLVRAPVTIHRVGSSRGAHVRIQTVRGAKTEEILAVVREAVAGLDAEVSVEWDEHAARE